MKPFFFVYLVLFIAIAPNVWAGGVVDTMNGDIHTQAETYIGDYVGKFGHVKINMDTYRDVTISGTVSNHQSRVLTSGAYAWFGTWAGIGMYGSDYILGGNVPLGGSVSDELEGVGAVQYSYVGNTNYGAEDKQRGFGCNTSVLFFNEDGTGDCRFVAEDYSSTQYPLDASYGVHRANYGSGEVGPGAFEFEIHYYWDDTPADGWNRKMSGRVRDIGGTWINGPEINAGLRITTAAASTNPEDWSAVVPAVMSFNSFINNSDPIYAPVYDVNAYGFDYDLQVVINDVLSGDADLDGDVDDDDLSLLLSGWGPTGKTWSSGDFDNDGDVDDDDLSVLLAGWTGVTSQTALPEPTTLVLFVCGGLAALKRSRPSNKVFSYRFVSQ